MAPISLGVKRCHPEKSSLLAASYLSSTIMHPFQNEETWTGGDFEVLFYLGEKSEIHFLEKLWFGLEFDGPYTNNKIIPEKQQKLNTLKKLIN